jgi:hypothetical protein
MHGLGILLAILASAVPTRAEFLIDRDTFSRKGVLNNSAPDRGDSRWIADTAWKTDGSRAMVDSESRCAFLPFKPRPDNVYTLSLQLACTHATHPSEWIACGFARGFETKGNWANINRPTGWILLRAKSGSNDQAQCFPGGNAGIFNGPRRVSIVLDTRPTPASAWTFHFMVDGKTVIGPVPAPDAWQITCVGLGNSSGLGWADELSLTSLRDDSLEKVADGIVAITPPHGESLILPTMPPGFKVSIKNSSNPSVIGLDGTVTRSPSDATVEVVLVVTRESDGKSRDIPPLKVFVSAARKKPHFPNYAENFQLRQGLFITWTGMPDGTTNTIVFSDGKAAVSMDQLADSANVNAVADEVAKFGFDHVVLMDFHGAGTTLHPCVALDSWRGPGFTSKRDLIGEMIDAFRARRIQVYLFTHPLDGHDYSPEQQSRLGFNDPSDGYRQWNDFVNDVHAEIVERYGDRILGIGMDSEFGLSSDPKWQGKLDLPRLRNTILSRGPGLSLSALAGPNATCEFGVKEVWRPSWLDPWKSRSDTDYEVEKWPAYRRVVAVVQGDHWATVTPPAKGQARLTGAQMFRYTVLQAGAATEGPGVQWAASPYTDGTWEKGIARSFADLEALVRPVSESLRQVLPSTSFRTPEGTFLSTLPHGIAATKKPDDSVEYIHVLNPPPGKDLSLPLPADGKHFDSASLLANGHPVRIRQTDQGLVLTLDSSDNWARHDTVIKLSVSPESRPPSNVARHAFVTASSSVENKGLGGQTPWGLIRLVDGQTSAEEAPASWSSGNYGWSSAASSVRQKQWIQIDLGREHLIDSVRLHPRADKGNVGKGFPPHFEILTSRNGSDWESVAHVANQAPPTATNTCVFPKRETRFLRIVADTRPTDIKNAKEFSLQFSEIEVFSR